MSIDDDKRRIELERIKSTAPGYQRVDPRVLRGPILEALLREAKRRAEVEAELQRRTRADRP